MNIWSVVAWNMLDMCATAGLDAKGIVAKVFSVLA